MKTVERGSTRRVILRNRKHLRVIKPLEADRGRSIPMRDVRTPEDDKNEYEKPRNDPEAG